MSEWDRRLEEVRREERDRLKPSCHYCATSERELRPYGPGGSWVCCPCIKSTPERNGAAQAAFGALLDATAEIAPTGVIAIGETCGPRPFDLREIDAAVGEEAEPKNLAGEENSQP